MSIAFLDSLLNHMKSRTAPEFTTGGQTYRRRLPATMGALFLVSALLLCAGMAYSLRAGLLAGSAGASACASYRVEPGDTLSGIAQRYHTTIWTLAHANSIDNINLIFVNQQLCIPERAGRHATSAGIAANGAVRWYAYDALDWSNRTQVRRLLYRAAAIHHLPAHLVLAIAWQESGWTQHVIAWDGGIGVMQVMPYTAMGINASTGRHLDPYDLWDNLTLGATYLQWLWQAFHGDLTKVISGYNEGGWAVRHRGIFNWSYVNSVQTLMKRMY